ncbi:MAG: GtrA family protein, partial [bacterium]
PKPKFNLHILILRLAKFLEDKSWFGAEYKICLFPLHRILSTNHSVLQLFEFALIGALGTVINFIVYLSLNMTIVAWFLGILSATLSNFILNKWLVFESIPPSKYDKDMIKSA